MVTKDDIFPSLV